MTFQILSPFGFCFDLYCNVWLYLHSPVWAEQNSANFDRGQGYFIKELIFFTAEI